MLGPMNELELLNKFLLNQLRHKAYGAKYYADNREKLLKYQKSDKYKASKAKYQKSDKYKAYRDKYEKSDKYKAYRDKYEKSDKRKAYRAKYRDKKRYGDFYLAELYIKAKRLLRQKEKALQS